MTVASFRKSADDLHALDYLRSDFAANAPSWWSDHWRYRQVDPWSPDVGAVEEQASTLTLWAHDVCRPFPSITSVSPEDLLDLAIERRRRGSRKQIDKIKKKIELAEREAKIAAGITTPPRISAEFQRALDRLPSPRAAEHSPPEPVVRSFAATPMLSDQRRYEYDHQGEVDKLLALHQWRAHGKLLVGDIPPETLRLWPPATCDVRTRKIVIHYNKRGGSA